MALEGFLCGAAAGAVGRVVVTPLAVLRIRLQVMHGPIRPSLRQTVAAIWREDGWRGLWRGGLTGQLLYASYSGVQFALFHELVALRPYASPLASDFVCGALAGTSATVITFPFDVLRTHMVLCRTPPFSIPNPSLLFASRSIVAREGFPGFFRGLTPSLMTIIPSSALSFTVYGFLSRTFKRDLAPWESAACGAVAGMVAQTTVFPLDLAKKRMQAQSVPRLPNASPVPHYRGTLDCLYQTFSQEGFLGLFRGGGVTIIKQSVAAAVIFSVNDWLRRSVASRRAKKVT